MAGTFRGRRVEGIQHTQDTDTDHLCVLVWFREHSHSGSCKVFGEPPRPFSYFDFVLDRSSSEIGSEGVLRQSD